MAEAVFSIPITGTIDLKGDSLVIKVNESTLTIKIDGGGAGGPRRLKLERGQTLFDLVLDAAKTMVKESNKNEFTAADLYHVAIDKHPELNLKSNSWGAHVVSSAPNHPSYDHSTARRKYFRYLGNGKYSLDPVLLSEPTVDSEAR